jgi:hypothetical protein
MQQLTQSLGREGNSRFVSSTAEIVATLRRTSALVTEWSQNWATLQS